MTENQYEALKQHSKETNTLVRECLKSALVKLAREKSYENISVTELCRRAGVSRMAFYRNYRDVNELFQEMARDLNAEIVDAVGSPFRFDTSREWYVRAFRIILKNQEAMSLMFEEEFQYEWVKVVNGFAIHNDTFSTEKKLQRLMWCGGFESAVSYWLKSGMRETPEEMAEYCFRYLPHVIECERMKNELYGQERAGQENMPK